MSERVIKSEFAEKIRRSRETWDSRVQEISRREMEQPGFCGNWSLKDVMLHIVWYEREMINLLKTRAFAGSAYWELPTDKRNTVIIEENKNLGLDQILDESREVFTELKSLIALLSDDDLNDPAHFPGMPSDWQPWQVIASNTYEHYDDHLRHADAWLQKRETS